jgi:hypothetical protein
MIIAIDEAVPYWEEAFSGLGDIRPIPGRNLKRETIQVDVGAGRVRNSLEFEVWSLKFEV